MTSAGAVADAVLGLDRWFESMRVDWPSPGYGGPVVHWWNHCLVYTGAGFDWRYEGIVDGYLTLWRQSGNRLWLERAIRAGDDLVAAQRPDGQWPNSRFELNPGSGGTPHEAACAVALLSLAGELGRLNDAAADRYRMAARRNVESYWLGRLWNPASRTLWDSPDTPSFVPNKAATFVAALLLLQEQTGDDRWIDDYAIPIADEIIGMQTRAPGQILDGAIAQNRLGDQVVTSYFPLYVARCVPPLMQLADRTGLARYQDAALAAARFVARVREADGGLPQVLYAGGRVNRNPRWIAGAGDVVRALDVAAAAGEAVDSEPTVAWLLAGARGDGHIAAARGFGRLMPIVSRADRFADETGVAGWCDKAFRALAVRVDAANLAGVEPGAAVPRAMRAPSTTVVR